MESDAWDVHLEERIAVANHEDVQNSHDTAGVGATPEGEQRGAELTTVVRERKQDLKTAFGRKLDDLRRECGWTYEQLAEKVGISLDRVKAHISRGEGAHVATLKAYADLFSKELKRHVTVADLE